MDILSEDIFDSVKTYLTLQYFNCWQQVSCSTVYG